MRAYKVSMTTAPGIRKNNKDDQELGEDAVGFTSKGKYVVLWVADGAPGQSMIFEDLDFSPRVLAKYVGECFEETVFKNGVAKIPFDKAFVTDFIHTLDEKISIRISDMHTKFATMHNVNFDDILEYQETPAKDDPANLPATPVNVATINPDVTAKVEAILNVATPQGDSKVKVVSTDPSKEEKKDDTAQLSPDTIYLNNHKVKASIKVFDFLKGKGKQKPVQESKNEVPVVLVAPPLVAPATPAAPTLIAPMTIPIVKVATDEPVIIKKADASDAVIPIVVQGEPSYGLAPVATPATAAVTPSTTTLVDTVIPPTTVIPPVIPMPKPVAPPKNVVKMNKTYGITWAVAFTGALIDTEKKIGSIISIGDCIALFNPAEGYEVQIDNKIPASTTIIHDPTNSKKPDVPLVTVDSSQDIPCRVPSAVEVKSVQEAQEAPDENEDREEDNESIQQTVAAQDKITKKSFSIGEITSKITGTISEYTSSIGSFFKKQAGTIGTSFKHGIRDSVDLWNEILYGKTDYSTRVEKERKAKNMGKGKTHTQLKDVPQSVEQTAYPAYKPEKYHTQLKSVPDTQKKVPIGVIVPSPASSTTPSAAPAVKPTQNTKQTAKNATLKTEEKQNRVNDVNNFRTVMDKTNKLFIKWSSPEKFDSYKVEHIMHIPMVYIVQNLESMILMSDGVMAYNDLTKLLSESTLDNVWDKLKSINNKTDDDKTAIFFGLLE